jgi:hypothetical protein
VIEKDKEVCCRTWPISSARASRKQKSEARHRSAKVRKISTRLNEGGWGQPEKVSYSILTLCLVVADGT